MKSGLITDDLNNSLNSLIGECFLGNRLLDRDVSLLSVKFVMNNCVKYLHESFSHRYPLLADMISSYQDSRNNLSVYPATPEGSKDYASPLELFNDFYNYQIAFEESVKEVLGQAVESGDETTAEFLKQFLLVLSKYTNQVILLCDKAESYGNNYMDFDRDIKKFFIFKELTVSGM